MLPRSVTGSGVTLCAITLYQIVEAPPLEDREPWDAQFGAGVRVRPVEQRSPCAAAPSARRCQSHSVRRLPGERLPEDTAYHDVFVIARVAAGVLKVCPHLSAPPLGREAPLAILCYARPSPMALGRTPPSSCGSGSGSSRRPRWTWFGLRTAPAAGSRFGLFLFLPLQGADGPGACWEHAEVVRRRRAGRRLARCRPPCGSPARLRFGLGGRRARLPRPPEPGPLRLVPVLAVLITFRGRWRDVVKPLAAFVSRVVLAWALVLGIMLVAGRRRDRRVRTDVFLAQAAFAGGAGLKHHLADHAPPPTA